MSDFVEVKRFEPLLWKSEGARVGRMCSLIELGEGQELYLETARMAFAKTRYVLVRGDILRFLGFSLAERIFGENLILDFKFEHGDLKAFLSHLTKCFSPSKNLTIVLNYPISAKDCKEGCDVLASCILLLERTNFSFRFEPTFLLNYPLTGAEQRLVERLVSLYPDIGKRLVLSFTLNPKSKKGREHLEKFFQLARKIECHVSFPMIGMPECYAYF